VFTLSRSSVLPFFRLPPYEYYEDNKVTGIDMDIMQAIADELGMDMQ